MCSVIDFLADINTSWSLIRADLIRQWQNPPVSLHTELSRHLSVQGEGSQMFLRHYPTGWWDVLLVGCSIGLCPGLYSPGCMPNGSGFV